MANCMRVAGSCQARHKPSQSWCFFEAVTGQHQSFLHLYT